MRGSYFLYGSILDSSIYSESCGIWSSIVFPISTKLWLFEKNVFFTTFRVTLSWCIGL